MSAPQPTPSSPNFTLTDEELRRLRAAPLVNVDQVFALILRSFDGKPDEILAELFQNSQRAQATAVSVDFTYTEPTPETEAGAAPEGETLHQPWRTHAQGASARRTYTRMTYSDNGAGIQGPTELLALLCLGESAWDAEVERTQQPLGVGFYALIANDQVTRIALRSNYVAFELEPARWRHDSAYRTSWLERLRPLAAPAPGFTLEVDASSELLAEYHRQCAGADCIRYGFAGSPPSHCHPALGYGDYFTLQVCGQPRPLRMPADVRCEDAPIAVEYRGNTLRIAPSLDPAQHGKLTLNWYGQLIALTLPYPHVRAYYHVRQGTPLTLLAPTRRGAVEDEAYSALLRQIVDAVFAHILAHEPPSARELVLLYAIDRDRARACSPYVVIRQHGGLNPSFAEASDMEARPHTVRVVRRDDLARYPLVTEGVTVVRPPDAQPDGRWAFPAQWDASTHTYVRPQDGLQDEIDYEYGLPSFIAALGLTLYAPVVGCEATLDLVWALERDDDGIYTPALGRWGLRRHGEAEPAHWELLPPNATVFVATEASTYDIQESDVLFGTGEIRTALQRFGRAGHCHSDEHGETCCDDFDASVDALIRERYLHRPAIAGTTAINRLWDALPRTITDANSPIACVDLLYTADPDAVAGAAASAGASPAALRVRLADGSTHFVQVYGA